jgi:hypothetical protein
MAEESELTADQHFAKESIVTDGRSTDRDREWRLVF